MKRDASFVMGLAGAAMVLGFFLPFLDVGMATISGSTQAVVGDLL